MSAEVVFELKSVTVPARRNPDARSISNINWTVRRAEFWVIGGFQGAGKSDLMFMLAGLTRPIEGDYMLFDQSMSRQFGDEFLPNRLRMGMVFDDARLLRSRTVAENVALPIRYHQDVTPEASAGWVSALLSETQVTPFAGEPGTTLPRAWQRRVALARALALRPELLFLENPLRGLDRRHSRWWVEFTTMLWRGHALMAGKPITLVVSTDEFWPWRECGAQFARLHNREMTLCGAEAPHDDAHLEQGATEEEKTTWLYKT